VAEIRLDRNGQIRHFSAFRRTPALPLIHVSPAGRQGDPRVWLSEICAGRRHPQSEVRLPPAGDRMYFPVEDEAGLKRSGPLLPEMKCRLELSFENVAAATGTASHPIKPQVQVDFAISVALASDGSMERLAMMWAEASPVRHRTLSK
jgi:hypothetical protein